MGSHSVTGPWDPFTFATQLHWPCQHSNSLQPMQSCKKQIWAEPDSVGDFTGQKKKIWDAFGTAAEGQEKIALKDFQWEAGTGLVGLIVTLSHLQPPQGEHDVNVVFLTVSKSWRWWSPAHVGKSCWGPNHGSTHLVYDIWSHHRICFIIHFVSLF